ncbi:DUF1127 domain-containing protein [Marinomonas mediterranea]|jgi:Uncharacterized conserved small protein|uniref:YjiS-like domain-containing protein n=1 Tax=Marinomonas mediterranea (strain ATCC 700492 / JCM 21426 / NBRC 103028 / MMB-1) TaxID=717774 RepID=F2JYL9_MARM1|nr:DUF1127 domain-containing protein [Marinomonas mediterranea]ADZ93148.1 protein of unknown function DUF1127 [Marinomonas mediterranea MMB-1]WCN11055.1 DUF1127 domain-containing protein [Marinomonas mediterranea]WCN15113.1 DUF1127 domain-containing protein [Marinomonas mediterranea]WCN19156.1 DUF1127 domain-containing protein [Marinomonas mediterranea MMB-1]
MSHAVHFQAQSVMTCQQQSQQGVCKERLEKAHPSQSKTRVQRVLNMIARVHHNWRTRSQLAKLDDAALKDIGVMRSDAYNELHKPLWK